MPPGQNPFTSLMYPPVLVEDLPPPRGYIPPRPYSGTVEEEFAHLSTPEWVEWLYENMPGLLSGQGGTNPRTNRAAGSVAPDPFAGSSAKDIINFPNFNQATPATPVVPVLPPAASAAMVRQTAPGGVSALNVEPPGAPMLPTTPTVLPTENVTAGRLPYRTEFPARTQDFYDQLAERSLMQGENAAMADREIQQNTLMGGGINLGDVWEKGKDIFFSDPMQNFFQLSRDALAQPARFGDWGVEPFARAQVAREAATAAAQQEVLLEQIKKGPTGMIDANWKAEYITKISKYSGARKLMDDMRKLAGEQVGGVFQSGAKFLNNLGDILAMPALGLNPQEHMNAMRAQLIAYLSGAFGREMNKTELALVKKMIPKSWSATSSQDFLQALDTFQGYIDNELSGAMSVAKEGGFGQAAYNTLSGASYTLHGQQPLPEPTTPVVTPVDDVPLGTIGEAQEYGAGI